MRHGDTFRRQGIAWAMRIAAERCIAFADLIGGIAFRPPQWRPDFERDVNAIDGVVATGMSRFVLVTSFGTVEKWRYVPDDAA